MNVSVSAITMTNMAPCGFTGQVMQGISLILSWHMSAVSFSKPMIFAKKAPFVWSTIRGTAA